MTVVRLTAALMTMTMVWGCSTLTSYPDRSQVMPAYSNEAPLPDWTQKSQGEAQSVVWFVGQGQARSEASARLMAEDHAQAHYVRHLGADVVATSRSRIATNSARDGVVREKVEGQSDTGISSEAYVARGSYEYHVRQHNGDFLVWARYTIPRQAFQSAQRAADKAYSEEVNKRIEAKKLVEESRYTGKNGLRFTMVTGEAVSGYNPVRPIQSESRAITKARNEATMKIIEALLGQNLTSERRGESTYLSGSSQGRIFHEDISSRVWVLGEEIKAEITVLGWTPAQ